MAMPPIGFDWNDLRGEFRNLETRVDFHYKDSSYGEEAGWADFPHEVFVGPDDQTRAARVLKTVAYVVTDEDDDGPVVECWPIRTLWRHE